MATDPLTLIHTLISLIGIVAGFGVPALHRLAPTGQEPPFAIAQGVVVLIFLWLGIGAFRRFRPGPVRAG